MNEVIARHHRWRAAGAALVALFIGLLAMAGSAKAETHSEHFCWGATVKKGVPCLGLYDGESGGVHEYVTGIYVSGVEHSVCVTNFLGQSQNKKCTGGPGQGVFLDLVPGPYFDYGWISNNTGVQSDTTVYGVIYWNDPPTNPPPPPPPPPPVWSAGDNLGGPVLGNPDVSSWGHGRLDVFARGTDDQLQHRFYVSGSGWSSWLSHGGTLASGVGAVSWGSNRIDVVGRNSSNNLLHWWYDGSWHNENLGGTITGDPDISSWSTGRLDVFAKGTDGTLVHKWYNGTTWSGWESLGGSLTSGPGAVSWGSNRIDVVARATDASVTHWWYDGSWHSDNLGGVITDDPDIASWGVGRLDVFARGSGSGEHALHHKSFTNGTTWSGWENLGGVFDSGPGAVAWDNNRLDVFGRMEDNSVTHWWFGTCCE